MGISNRQTVEEIKENPYLQYFIGMSSYINEARFDASMLVHFREIISANVVNKVNQMMVKKYKRGPLRKHKKKETQKVLEQKNRGKLILDGTCAPIDISYPTDLGILNQARKQTERIIDSLYEQMGRLYKKPSTYRELAIKDYIVVAKKVVLGTNKEVKP
ncbi:hypothetical protein RintRC_4166 [Richelia intracellularis]|nr:hypothetical protein RintRC_4166 [Richelia intracellularis]